MEDSNDVQVTSYRGGLKTSGQECSVLQQMVGMERSGAVAHILTEVQVVSR